MNTITKNEGMITTRMSLPHTIQQRLIFEDLGEE